MRLINRLILLSGLLLCFLPALVVIADDPIPAEACVGGQTPRLTPGEHGRVTPGAPNNLRAAPGTRAALLTEIPGLGEFAVLTGPVCADGLNWWQVDYQGQVGWTAEGRGQEYWIMPRLVNYDSMNWLEDVRLLGSLPDMAAADAVFVEETAFLFAADGGVTRWHLPDPYFPRPPFTIDNQQSWEFNAQRVFIRQGRVLLARIAPDRLTITDLETGETAGSLPWRDDEFTREYGDFDLSPAGDYAAVITGDENRAAVYALAGDAVRPLAEITDLPGPPNQLRLAPEGRLYVAGAYFLRLYDISQPSAPALRYEWTAAPLGFGHLVHFQTSRDGRYVAHVAPDYRTLYLWDSETGEQVLDFQPYERAGVFGFIRGFTFSPAQPMLMMLVENPQQAAFSSLISLDYTLRAGNNFTIPGSWGLASLAFNGTGKLLLVWSETHAPMLFGRAPRG